MNLYNGCRAASFSSPRQQVAHRAVVPCAAAGSAYTAVVQRIGDVLQDADADGLDLRADCQQRPVAIRHEPQGRLRIARERVRAERRRGRLNLIRDACPIRRL